MCVEKKIGGTQQKKRKFFEIFKIQNDQFYKKRIRYNEKITVLKESYEQSLILIHAASRTKKISSICPMACCKLSKIYFLNFEYHFKYACIGILQIFIHMSFQLIKKNELIF
ncbi:hypothetical protein BpHYR1_050102, partial [Brachionus plicatilis]